MQKRLTALPLTEEVIIQFLAGDNIDLLLGLTGYDLMDDYERLQFKRYLNKIISENKEEIRRLKEKKRIDDARAEHIRRRRELMRISRDSARNARDFMFVDLAAEEKEEKDKKERDEITEASKKRREEAEADAEYVMLNKYLKYKNKYLQLKKKLLIKL